MTLIEFINRPKDVNVFIGSLPELPLSELSYWNNSFIPDNAKTVSGKYLYEIRKPPSDE